MSKPIFLSASRIETFSTCSQLYSAKYNWRIPDFGNDGSNRGSVVHDVLELLAKPRHKKRYDDAINHGSCKDVPVLWKLVKRFAVKYRVNDEANLKMIDGFIMVALYNHFFGPKETVSVHAEKEFSIQVNEPGKRFNVRGVIDKIFEIAEAGISYVEGMDFKSSKKKFEDDKLDHNLQSYIYQIALRRMFPKAVLRRFHFLFLKFAKDPIQEQPVFTEEQLSGFETQLSQYQVAMENFTLAQENSNLALYDENKKWLCGAEGNKKDGAPKFICSARKPLDYFVLLDEEGEFVASAFTEAELNPKEGQIIVPRSYPGCVGYYNQKTGLRRNCN